MQQQQLYASPHNYPSSNIGGVGGSMQHYQQQYY